MMNFQELCSPLPQVARANFNEDPYVQDFGIAIDQKMVTVTGRILPPPLLQYGGKVGRQVQHHQMDVSATIRSRNSEENSSLCSSEE